MADEQVLIEDRPPLTLPRAFATIVRCIAVSVGLLLRGRVRQPVARVDETIAFADGSHGRVYRETIVAGADDADPALLVVTFRLRGIHGRVHGAFRAESLLNTPLFVGFRGFVSKLWLAHDEHDRYRGVYEWKDPRLADAYARALWWVLALVCDRSSIHYVVVPGLRRDEPLTDARAISGEPEHAWWRPVVTHGRSSSTATGPAGHESG
jgi:hypothetical protein